MIRHRYVRNELCREGSERALRTVEIDICRIRSALKSAVEVCEIENGQMRTLVTARTFESEHGLDLSNGYCIVAESEINAASWCYPYRLVDETQLFHHSAFQRERKVATLFSITTRKLLFRQMPGADELSDCTSEDDKRGARMPTQFRSLNASSQTSKLVLFKVCKNSMD